MDRPDTDLGPTFLAISWTTVSLAAVLVALRAFVRFKMHANGWDDYLIYLAWVSVYHHLSVLDTTLRTFIELVIADKPLWLNPRRFPGEVRVRTACRVYPADCRRTGKVLCAG